MVDPFEEFEFKPLTEGLGFHKKAEKVMPKPSSRANADAIFGKPANESPRASRSASDFGADLDDDLTSPGRTQKTSQKTSQSRTAGKSKDEFVPTNFSTSGFSKSPFDDDPFDKNPFESGSSLLSNDSKEPRSSLFSSDLSLNLNEPDKSEPSNRQSISDLIASLPPSLDFIDEQPEKIAPKASALAPPKASLTATSPLKASAGPSLYDKEPSADRPQIFQPLGREDYKATGSNTGPTIGSMLPTPGSKAGGTLSPGVMTPGAPAVPAVPAPTTAKPASSPYRERLDESYARAFPHAEKTKKEAGVEETASPEGLQFATVNLAAGVLDGMVIAGVSTILLVAILAITRINLVGLLSNAHTDTATQLNLGILFLAVMQMYLLISRAFFGASLGEWAFDQQLGTEDDRKKLSYPFKVAWRTLLVTLSGLILLPILSALMKKDLAASLTGLQLYRRL